MLDVVLRNVTFRRDGGFALRGVDFTVPRSTHTAVIGPPGCGASTLLQLISGTLRPQEGDVLLGTRRVNEVKPAGRPILSVTSELDVPRRWSVQHALIAAVRTRSLDRQDRHHEYQLTAEKWELAQLLERKIATLSSTEATRVQLARIELLRPAILVADRLLERLNPAVHATLSDTLFRTLRVLGTTVITTPASRVELAATDATVVLDRGRVVQSGPPAEVFARPLTAASAVASGEADEVPLTIRGATVESVIGSWEIEDPPFQGSGVAIVRPADFSPARPGEDSDLIFGIEEAGFAGGRWIARGVLSGGMTLRVELPADAPIHKGRLLALRYDPSRFTLIQRNFEPAPASVPLDVVPPMRETR